MALTVTDLAAALRLGDGTTAPEEPVNALLTRLLGVGQAFIDLLADGAPLPIQEEALIRFCGYLYDSPTAARRDGYSNAWRNSGAGALVARWVVRRIVDSDGVTPSGGTTPGGGVASPLLVATVDVTNAQIKNLDTAYIELLSAPSVSEYIKVDQIWFHKFGADAPTITSSSPTPNAASLNHYTNYIIAMLITNPAATLPLGGDRTDYIWVYGSDLQQGGELLRAQPYLDGASVGGHGFSEGTALVLGLVASPARYSAAAWDEFIASVNDVSMRISVFYSIHSRPAV